MVNSWLRNAAEGVDDTRMPERRIGARLSQRRIFATKATFEGSKSLKFQPKKRLGESDSWFM